MDPLDAHGANDAPRHVAFDGAFNFRDLGGYPTLDGRVTRWRRLYRSDSLAHLSERDEARFRALAITTVIDLRSPSEIAHGGVGRHGAGAGRLINTAVNDWPDSSGESPPAPVISDLTVRYLQYLDEGGPAFATALRSMTHSENFPIVFNCFWGKDRSGVLAAIALSCLDVEPAVIASDYALSSRATPRLIERLRHDPVYRDTLDRTPAALLASDTETMARFIRDAEEKFGGLRAWALSAGLTASELDSLREELLA